MKALVFPGLHQPPLSVLGLIENWIRRERPDRTVFLGDYFDQFNDTPDDAERIALWVRDRLKDETRFHLIGNHDAS